ncbi:UPF0489 family protein [Desulfofalx alkaliphila]|uniref:UPF0489 family protein n=1 Tax=Desulfofalx alkaliphila TaxID=105483 RepID=UPI00146FB4EF|nr:UPF0489 family protein [Desulfofalx alkaliphila]
MIAVLTVPLFIIEEHHEAFFIWHYGYFNKLINPFGNTLLRVDSHEDMLCGCLGESVDQLEEDLSRIYRFTYQQLGIATFIIPAIYRGVINNYTFLCKYSSYEGKRTDKYVASYKSEGKCFKIGEINGFLPLQLQSEGNPWGRHQFYRHQEIGLGSSFTTGQPLILDIDLDFFSCDNSLSSTVKRIEITERAYHDFINNKYNPFRIMPDAALTAKKESDGYYLYYTEWQETPNYKKVSPDVIDKRISRFVDFLKQNDVKPKLIDICRSRFSGYTPGDQWEYIENKLIEGLGQLYDLSITHIDELKQRFDS